MYLNLYHIEESVRANFVFEGKARKPEETDAVYERRIATQHSLYVNRDIECTRLMALACFIGLGRLYGFPLNDIKDYLGIESSLFKDCISLYDKFMEQAINIKLGGGELPICSKACKVMSKTVLIKNYLNRKFPA